MELFPIFSPDFFCNSYMIFEKTEKNIIIIDPIDFTEDMLIKIENKNLFVKAILLTGSYQTYIKGINKLLKIYSPEIYTLNPDLYQFESKKIYDNSEIKISKLTFKVKYVNYGAINSAIFICENFIFTGDYFFAGKFGKIDLPSIDKFDKDLISLFDIKKFNLICPKYGPISILKNELEHEKD